MEKQIMSNIESILRDSKTIAMIGVSSMQKGEFP